MLVSDFDYHLPKELIAQKSVKPRDSSRLLVVNRRNEKIQHKHFFDLPKFLKKGDLLVFNDTKVFKARLFGFLKCHSRVNGNTVLKCADSRFRGNDIKIEIFLLRPINKYEWEVLGRPGKKLTPSATVVFGKNLKCAIKEKKDDVIIVKFNQAVSQVLVYAARAGHIPVPPYVEKEPTHLADYQTIYAKQTGSVAAPTAGFHFTPRLLKELKKKGVETAFVTLHVGLGTFRPVKTEKVEEHKMHSEWAEIGAKTAAAINRAKAEGRRVIAVGTTTARTLEGAAAVGNGVVSDFSGEINLFITPGFKFQIIDGLITNFHLPKSTLLMLVSAFIGSRPRALLVYQKAVKLSYCFFSFGDAMLII